MSAFTHERILSLHHWTDTLFSFTTTRDPGFRFRSGEFTMIGLEIAGRPLLRAYSIVSACYDDVLEFLSIKVPHGPLTSRLQHVRQGDSVLVSRKPTGTLVADHLLPGRNLLMLATGTGLAPFMSLIKDPHIYERYEKVVLVHGCRQVSELAYGKWIERELPRNELVGEQAARQLIYYPTVTREPFRHRGRITDLIATGQLAADTGLPELSPRHDRIMLCGGPQMVQDIRTMLTALDFTEGSGSAPGSLVVEKAFVER